ncbi:MULTISPECIES: carbohydrate ABC transporter permease [unclassified Microbacterium]|uniref:carbohydrate ABC transporter permease n=1 Tax=unclassified Microbacterium TaxID=2609290 RepID=UPI0030173657
MLYAILIAGCIPTLLPFIWLVRSAFMDDGQIFVSPPEWIPNPWKFDNFSQAFDVQPFFDYLLNTLIIEAGVVTGTVISCSLAAFAFARLRWRGRNIAFGITLSTMLLPYAVTIIPTFIMWRSVGALDTFVPLIVPAWFGAAGGGAFYIFLLRQFFLTIPYELDEAAYMDGASVWWVFWRIVLPLSKPAIAVVVVFTFVNTWNDFLGPLIYLTSQENFTLALGLAAFQGTYTGQWGLLMAAAALVTVPIILLFFLAQRYFVEGITFTGGK